MGRKKQEKVEEEEKKDGRRDTGVQAKKGWLYILLPRTKVEEGQKVSSKRWVATGLADTDKNLKKAKDMPVSVTETTLNDILEQQELITDKETFDEE